MRAGDNGFESGADGYFRLAEAHVAAEQPLHGGVGFHICLDFQCAAGLVRRVFIDERALHLSLPICIRFVGKAFSGAAFGVETHDVCCQKFYLLSGFALGVLPFCAADAMQCGFGALFGYVLAHHIQLIGGQIHAVIVGVAEYQTLGVGAVQADDLEAFKDADAVFHVHHIVAGFERIVIRDLLAG